MKMIIFEFCGNPGMGKTQLSRQAQHYFEEKGYKVADNIEWISPNTIPGRINRRLRKKGKYLALDSIKVEKIFSKKYLDSLDENSRYWYDRIVDALCLIRYAKRHKCSFVFFDEGILQYITSMVHDQQIDGILLGKAKQLIDYVYNENFMVFDCYLNQEENIHRLLKRNKSDDRFVKESKDEMCHMLEIKRNNIDQVVGLVSDTSVVELDIMNGDIARDTIISSIEKIL